jgi:hypothetical protein
MSKLMDLRGRVKLRRLTRTDLAYLHFKAALGIMLFVPILQNPSLQQQTTGLFLLACVIVTGVGLAVSLMGLVLGAQEDDVRRAGIWIEMIGLTLLMAGPLVFLAVQVGIGMAGGRWSGLAIMFPYVVIAALVCRIVMVWDSAKPVVYRIRGLEPDDLG